MLRHNLTQLENFGVKIGKIIKSTIFKVLNINNLEK